MKLTSSRPAALIASGTSQVRAAFDRRRRIARITRELGGMSDRDLADIGILRCDIHRVARDAVHGR